MHTSARVRSLELERVHRDDVAWRLLRADNAPLILALLSIHLGGAERRLPATELYDRIDADLDDLRAQGRALPLTAQAYCSAWRNEQYLVRRPGEDVREETYELSPGAATAIRITNELDAPRQGATESRLMSVATQLGRLALDTDADIGRRTAELIAQRDRIDAELERLAGGEIVVLDDERAYERLVDIVGQAADIPADFARVRAEFDELGRLLRRQVLDADAAQTMILNDVFRGVDLIGASDAGRTFAAFSQLLLDPELAASFESDVERVLGSRFADRLPGDQRRVLRGFLRMLKRDNSEIHRVMTTFARGLRRYVQTQEFHRDRVLRDLLRDTLAAGSRASEVVRPWSSTRIDIDLSSVAVASVSSLKPYDPSDHELNAVAVRDNEPVALDIEALRAITRETEIDFAELTANVNCVVDEIGEATVREVLDRRPATQGVASVVGLIALAGANGRRDEDTVEAVRWRGSDGRDRSAVIPTHTFLRRIP